MTEIKNNKGTPSKKTGVNDQINLDYDWNTEYGDGDIPDIDKPNNSVSDNKNKKTGTRDPYSS